MKKNICPAYLITTIFTCLLILFFLVSCGQTESTESDIQVWGGDTTIPDFSDLETGEESTEETTPPSVELIDLPVTVPANPVIVFCSDRTGNSEIFYMSIDGSNLVQVTANPYADYHPRFSPDFKQIVYVSYCTDTESAEIFISNVDGTDIKRLTENEFSDADPCFTPDGSKIIFGSERPESSIYIMNMDSLDMMKIKDSETGSYSDYCPVISPDGKRILFASGRTHSDEIYIMDLDGSNLESLTSEEGWDGRPSFSTDGTKIVFTSDRDSNNTGSSDIYIMNADGSGVKRLTDLGGFSTDPCFSPDGTKIVFSFEKFDEDEYLGTDIFIMDAVGSNIIQLTENQGDNYYPRFSPE